MKSGGSITGRRPEASKARAVRERRLVKTSAAAVPRIPDTTAVSDAAMKLVTSESRKRSSAKISLNQTSEKPEGGHVSRRLSLKAYRTAIARGA
jgi:hypothetical protein